MYIPSWKQLLPTFLRIVSDPTANADVRAGILEHFELMAEMADRGVTINNSYDSMIAKINEQLLARANREPDNTYILEKLTADELVAVRQFIRSFKI